MISQQDLEPVLQCWNSSQTVKDKQELSVGQNTQLFSVLDSKTRRFNSKYMTLDNDKY